MQCEPHNLPLNARRDFINRIFVRHDSVLRATQVLDIALRAGSRPRETSVGYIKGYSRCGKTETLKRFVETQTGVIMDRRSTQLIEGNGLLVIYIEVKTGGTPLGVGQEFLGAFNDLGRARLREQDVAGRMIDIGGDNGVGLLLLDELQNLFRTGGDKALAAASNFTTTLQNSAPFPIVVTGTIMLDLLFSLEDASDQRSDGRAFLKPFSFRTSAEKKQFKAFVQPFVATLPFLEKPDLADSDDGLWRTFFTTRGRPGALAKLCDRATWFAFEEAKGKVPTVLTRKHISSAFKFLYGDDPRMLGVNPWDMGDLPAIPLSINEVDPYREENRISQRGRALIH